jgi:hypothetical protein
MFYFDILKEFYDSGIKYLIVGGLSVNLHGIPRVTQDIDIIISLDRKNINGVTLIMKKLGYLPGLPVNPDDLSDVKIRESWIREKNLIAFSFYHPSDHYKVVDIVISHPLDFDSAYKNRIEKNIKDFSINLVSIDDLITMKNHSGRRQDLSDIELLKKLRIFMEENNE